MLENCPNNDLIGRLKCIRYNHVIGKKLRLSDVDTIHRPKYNNKIKNLYSARVYIVL